MDRWDYRVVGLKGKPAKMERTLKAMGLEVWELVSVTVDSLMLVGAVKAFFKRRIETP